MRKSRSKNVITNRYQPKDKVLIVGSKYLWGTVKSVRVAKKSFEYTVEFSHITVYKSDPKNHKFHTGKFMEGQLLRYMPKWKYRIHSLFNRIVW